MAPRVNQALAAEVLGLAPGTVLDLAGGAGGDAIWFTRHGWTVTGIDPRELAGPPAGPTYETTYDLVSWCFHDALPPFPRTELLRRAAALVAPGGHLLVVGQAAAPPWARGTGVVLGAREQLRLLDLAPGAWTTVVCEDRARGVHDADGTPALVEDAVTLLRRDERP